MLMELRQKISIQDHGGRGYANVTHCDIRLTPTLSGYRIAFDFKIETFSSKPEALYLIGWDVDLYHRGSGEPVIVGRLSDAQTGRPIEFNGHHNSVHQQLDMSAHDFILLVDRTHAKDVILEFDATPRFSNFDLYPNTQRGSLLVPHSEWIKLLNQAGLDRFELITIRIPVKESHFHTPFREALVKIREAESLYAHGHWNGAVASCRAAWKTILSATPSGGKALDHLLSPLIGDPHRKEFALAILRGFNDLLNQGVHLEGDVKSDKPPAELAPEDALMVLQLYSVMTGYLSSVVPNDRTV